MLASLGATEEGGPPRIEAWNKIDLLPPDERDRLLGEAARSDDVVPVSALTGEGIDKLRTAIVPSSEQETGFITSLRHEQLLRESLMYMEKAETAVRERIPHEMLLLDLYSALRPIDAITGATTADDILNRIFSTFCIGK